MSLPQIRVYIRPDASFASSGNLVLGSTPLGPGALLGPPGSAYYEISNMVQSVSIRRGRTRVTESFDAGSCSVTLFDSTGVFNPDNGSSPLNGYVKPLRQFRVTATIDSTEYVLFAGYADAYNYNYESGVNASIVTIDAVDAFRLFNLATVSTVAGTSAGQDTGTRIAKILDAVSMPTSLRSLETGVSQLAADPGSQRSVLAAIQQCEQTELGAFYMSAEGKATFKNRHTIQQLASGSTVAPLVFDESSGIDFVGIGQRFDEQQVVNDVSVATSTGTTQTSSDASSITAYFKRSYSKTDTLIQTSTEAADHAAFILTARKDPQVTIDSIVVNGRGVSEAQLESVVSTDLLVPVTVSKVYGSGTLTRTLTLQGIAHTITPNSWRIELTTAEPISGDGFILDSASFGVLDDNYLSF